MRGRSVAAVVRKGERILFGRRQPGGEIGGKWELPGGKVEPDESPEAALVREIAEELGVVAEPGAKLAEAMFVHAGVESLLEGYDVRLASETFHLTVHEEIGWYTLNDALDLDLAESDRNLLGKLLGDSATR